MMAKIFHHKTSVKLTLLFFCFWGDQSHLSIQMQWTLRSQRDSRRSPQRVSGLWVPTWPRRGKGDQGLRGLGSVAHSMGLIHTPAKQPFLTKKIRGANQTNFGAAPQWPADQSGSLALGVCPKPPLFTSRWILIPLALRVCVCCQQHLPSKPRVSPRLPADLPSRTLNWRSRQTKGRSQERSQEAGTSDRKSRDGSDHNSGILTQKRMFH